MTATQKASIVIAMALLGTFLLTVQSVSATLPAGLFNKVQKPELYLYLSSPDGKVKHAKVTVNIQDLSRTKTVTVSGKGYTAVAFDFPPVQRSWVDWFNVSVYNPSTGEINSYAYIWSDGLAAARGYLTVFNGN